MWLEKRTLRKLWEYPLTNVYQTRLDARSVYVGGADAGVPLLWEIDIRSGRILWQYSNL